MVNLYGNQKAVWELAIRYCGHSYLMKKQAKKVMNQVELEFSGQFRFAMISDPGMVRACEVFLAKRKSIPEQNGKGFNQMMSPRNSLENVERQEEEEQIQFSIDVMETDSTAYGSRFARLDSSQK